MCNTDSVAKITVTLIILDYPKFMNEYTGIKDKHGKPILVGDKLLHRLDKFGKKHDGTTVVRVVQIEHKYRVVPENNVEPNRSSGERLTEQFASRAVILEHAY